MSLVRLVGPGQVAYAAQELAYKLHLLCDASIGDVSLRSRTMSLC